MAEELRIKNLGPIRDVTIRPNRLTVLIGPQASGKSLIAQTLYACRGMETLVAGEYRSTLDWEENWQQMILQKIFSDIRGAQFGYFANGIAKINYTNSDNNRTADMHIHQKRKEIFPLEKLSAEMTSWVELWKINKNALTSSLHDKQIYIPTERSLFTRLLDSNESFLYSPSQPLTLRKFSEFLQTAKNAYMELYNSFTKEYIIDSKQRMKFVIEKQRQALQGEAYVPTRGPQDWKWRVTQKNKIKILPLQATSSGQLESWPFFAIAATYGVLNKSLYFYFEEPETHLHPRAQVAVMEVIAFLVALGHSFVVTTHSPYLLYVLNNMLQAHLAYNGNPPEGKMSLDPDMVSAYCLGASPRSIKNEETGLIMMDELEEVIDEIGVEFSELLDIEDRGQA